jgi:hypothetical protein
MCPSYMATRDEEASTRGRANALRLAMTGQLEPNAGQRPSQAGARTVPGVQSLHRPSVPTRSTWRGLKSEVLQMHHDRHGIPLGISADRRHARDGSLDRRPAGSRGQPDCPVAGIRLVMEKIAGMDRRRPQPPFATRSLSRLLNDRSRPLPISTGRDAARNSAASCCSTILTPVAWSRASAWRRSSCWKAAAMKSCWLGPDAVSARGFQKGWCVRPSDWVPGRCSGWMFLRDRDCRSCAWNRPVPRPWPTICPICWTTKRWGGAWLAHPDDRRVPGRAGRGGKIAPLNIRPRRRFCCTATAIKRPNSVRPPSIGISADRIDRVEEVDSGCCGMAGIVRVRTLRPVPADRRRPSVSRRPRGSRRARRSSLAASVADTSCATC